MGVAKDEGSCVDSRGMDPPRRYLVLTYSNHWDGWGLSNQFDDRDEAIGFADRLRDHDTAMRRDGEPCPAIGGIVVAEVIRQSIEPYSNPHYFEWRCGACGKDAFTMNAEGERDTAEFLGRAADPIRCPYCGAEREGQAG